MLAHNVLDTQVTIELPNRELLALVHITGSGIGTRLGDIIQLYLLPLIPVPVPIVAPYVYT